MDKFEKLAQVIKNAADELYNSGKLQDCLDVSAKLGCTRGILEVERNGEFWSVNIGKAIKERGFARICIGYGDKFNDFQSTEELSKRLKTVASERRLGKEYSGHWYNGCDKDSLEYYAGIVCACAEAVGRQ